MPPSNLLPRDGTVHDHGPVMSADDAAIFFETLRTTITWQHDVTVIFGKRIVTARQVAWYGDAAFPYKYSGTTKTALPWTPALHTLKNLVEARTGATFNSCLLNLYHDGSQGMGWHSDNEKTLAPDAPIASLSLGAERKFAFRHKHTHESTSLILENGSLLVMHPPTQSHWHHSLPKSKKTSTARINLTFRKMA